MHALIAAALAALLAQTATPVPDDLLLEWQVLSRRPHDVTAFTQGLEVDASGRLFESTGGFGRSSLREVDPRTGSVRRQVQLPDEQFGEGITVVGDRLLQLTWTNGVANVYDLETFTRLAAFEYRGQGWGLCHDGERLVMSDGSDTLTFRDPGSFEPVGAVTVTLGGEPVARLNELECLDGSVWANVWETDHIVRIDPDDGRVTGVLDLAGILEPHPARTDTGAVLNGIAYDAREGTFLVTGKEWPELIEISVGEPGRGPAHAADHAAAPLSSGAPNDVGGDDPVRRP